jgi:hypothetical protein
MSLEVDYSFISKLMVDKDLRFFEVRSLNKDLVFDQDKEDVTAIDAAQILGDFLTKARGKLNIKLSGKSRGQKSEGGANKSYNYIIEGLASQNSQPQSTGASSQSVTGNNMGIFGPKDVLEIINKQSETQIQALKRENELERQMQQLRFDMEKKASWLESLMEKHGHLIIPRLFGVIFPQAPAATVGITGSGANPIPTDPNQANEVLNNSIRRIAAVDPDYIDTLKLVADYLEKFPQLIPDLKAQLQMLINQ